MVLAMSAESPPEPKRHPKMEPQAPLGSPKGAPRAPKSSPRPSKVSPVATKGTEMEPDREPKACQKLEKTRKLENWNLPSHTPGRPQEGAGGYWILFVVV